MKCAKAKLEKELEVMEREAEKWKKRYSELKEDRDDQTVPKTFSH